MELNNRAMYGTVLLSLTMEEGGGGGYCMVN